MFVLVPKREEQWKICAVYVSRPYHGIELSCQTRTNWTCDEVQWIHQYDDRATVWAIMAIIPESKQQTVFLVTTLWTKSRINEKGHKSGTKYTISRTLG